MAFNSPAATPEDVASNQSVRLVLDHTSKYRFVDASSPFNSKSIVISVGTDHVTFSIHEVKLAQTAFFQTHDLITTPQGIEPRNELSACENADPSIGRVTASEHPETMKSESCSFQRSWKGSVDYHIEDRFFLEPAAFDVFVRYLYNEPPTKPTCRREVKMLFRAYGIAIRYKCYGLQNKIMDCLRQYFSLTKIVLDDMLWASNRFGDHLSTPLTAYLVEQVAFEIAENGFAEFAAANGFFDTFLAKGDRTLRLSLFKALSQHAKEMTIGDPATARRKFHVFEEGNRAGTFKA